MPPSAPAAVVGSGRNSILICHRHEDTQQAAGRLHDQLSGVYGAERVFLDTESLVLGTSFVSQIVDQIARSAVVLVVIEPYGPVRSAMEANFGCTSPTTPYG